LLFVFLIPRAPLRPIFGPIISTFWGDKFLHYPANFLLLDKLAFLSKLVLAVVFGSLLSAMAVLLLQEAYAKKQPQLKRSFLVSLKKYASLFLIVLVVTALFYFSVKLFTFGLAKYFMSGHKKLLFLGPRLWLGPLLIAFNFIISALIQSFFMYAIPFLMLENEKLFSSVIKSCQLCARLFIPTLVLVGLPLLLFIPVLILKLNAPYFINNFFPESFLFVLVLGVALNSLVIDPLVTFTTTILFLENRKK